MRLTRLVDDGQSPAGRAFGWVIQLLILASVVTFSIETLPDLPIAARTALQAAEVGFVAVFTTEYLLRLWAAEPKRRYALSFFGLIDLLAVLPFYLSLVESLLASTGLIGGGLAGAGFQAVRIFRLVRAFRLLKLARYSAAMRRFRRAFHSIRDELLLTGAVTGCVIFFAAVMVYHFEHKVQPRVFASIFHALWWAVVTLTTVGYGDVYPMTTGGKVFTGLLLIAGLGLISVPSGLIASALTATRLQDAPPDSPTKSLLPPTDRKN